jgi:hypothetical protein
VIDWLLHFGLIILTQLIGLFGIFFVFGFVLSKIESATHRAYHNSVGWKGILWTAWIGTPIHEIGHMVLAKLFRHRIERFSLFGPNEITGDLGYVDHSYSPRSIYQRIGNFFIGAAPLIFGSLFLVILLYTLVPNGRSVFVQLEASQYNIYSIYHNTSNAISTLFSNENIHSWNFWLFLYVSFCIVSHMAPSKRDRSNMWSGLFWIILLLIVINLIAILFGFDLSNTIQKTNSYLSIMIGVYAYAIMLSLIHLVSASIILWPFRKR